MAGKPAHAKAGRAVQRPNGLAGIASDIKAPVRKSQPRAAKPTRADKSALRRDCHSGGCIGRVFRARICGGAARGRGAARRCRQGHDLFAFP